jgi:hypothetical protein
MSPVGSSLLTLLS